MAKDDLPFIVSNGPKVPRDPAVRALIRRNAMRDVALTRKKRPKRINHRRLPIFLHDDPPAQAETQKTTTPIWTLAPRDISEVILGNALTSENLWSSKSLSYLTESNDSQCVSLPSIESDSAATNHDETPCIWIPSALTTLNLATPYEQARAEYDLSLADLAMLTNFHINLGAARLMFADRSRVQDLLGHLDWSYMEYVPSRYGSTECVTAAANCLLGTFRSISSPRTHENHSTLCRRLYWYDRALRSLQCALDDAELCLDDNILCGLQLLSLHELLDPSRRHRAWSTHVHGSARLIQLRSPKAFQSDFAKALLVSHMSGICAEAMSSHKPCYLEAPEWLEVFRSIAQPQSPKLTNRAPLAIELRVIMIQLPGVWHAVHQAVNNNDHNHNLFDPITLDNLDHRCRQSHTTLVHWLEAYEAHCARSQAPNLPSTELDLRRDLFGSALECLCIVKRLLATVCEPDRLALEAETQALARLLVGLQAQPSPKYVWLFSGYEVGVANVTMQTRDQWEEDVTGLDATWRKNAARVRYNVWNCLLRQP